MLFFPEKNNIDKNFCIRSEKFLQNSLFTSKSPTKEKSLPATVRRFFSYPLTDMQKHDKIILSYPIAEEHMNRELLKFQRRNRIAGTFLRLNWLIAVGAFVPMLMYGLLFGIALGLVLRVLILVMFVVLTLGAILAYEKFRALFHAESLEQMQALARDVVKFYQGLMPVFLALSALFLAVNLVFFVKSGGPSAGRIVSAVLAFLFTVIAAILYYTVALGVVS